MDIGGQWLGMWTIFAAGISNVALFEAEMSSDAFKIMGMGKSLFCIYFLALQKVHIFFTIHNF